MRMVQFSTRHHQKNQNTAEWSPSNFFKAPGAVPSNSSMPPSWVVRHHPTCVRHHLWTINRKKYGCPKEELSGHRWPKNSLPKKTNRWLLTLFGFTNFSELSSPRMKVSPRWKVCRRGASFAQLLRPHPNSWPCPEAETRNPKVSPNGCWG